MQSDVWWHTQNQDVQYQSLLKHKDYPSILNIIFSILLMQVPQFEDFVTKSNQLKGAKSKHICM